MAKLIAVLAGSDQALSQMTLIVAMQQIATMTGLATTLQQMGTSEADLDRLADDAMKQTRLLGNNPREMTLERGCCG